MDVLWFGVSAKRDIEDYNVETGQWLVRVDSGNRMYQARDVLYSLPTDMIGIDCLRERRTN